MTTDQEKIKFVDAASITEKRILYSGDNNEHCFEKEFKEIMLMVKDSPETFIFDLDYPFTIYQIGIDKWVIICESPIKPTIYLVISEQLFNILCTIAQVKVHQLDEMKLAHKLITIFYPKDDHGQKKAITDAIDNFCLRA